MASIKIKQGLVTGGISKTESGIEYLEFLEIPYAKPPIGDLRFKSPQHADSWEGERLATTASHRPSQINIFDNNSVAGTEDCLYLNVFTPIQTSKDKLLPVMVWIHGGGFAFGNGTLKDEAGQDFFIGKDVIVVAINYRLNVFGFLSLDIPEAAGNMGLKDQVMALKWVQENIEEFGGDKTNVTLFGISAGGAAIEYLILTPKCKNLFHKAIIQSGSTLNHWAVTYEHKLLAYDLAKLLGFTGLKIDYRGIYHYICKHSTDEIQAAFSKLLDTRKQTKIDFGIVPCVEKDFGDNEALLTDNPYNLLKQGKFNKIPILRGFCEAEGTITKALAPLAFKALQESNKFTRCLPNVIDETYNEKLSKAYSIKGRDATFDFFTDFDFISGVWIASKLMLDRMPVVYMYENSYDGEVNLKKMIGCDVKGCGHGDDSAYILNIPNFEPKTDADRLTRDRFVMMWTNFAKSGNPTPETNSTVTIKWPAFTRKDMVYLNINKELTLKSNYEPIKMELFSEIYNKYKM